MAEPAREDAPAPGPGIRQPVRRSDPNSPGWANVQRASCSALRILALAGAEAVSRGDDPILREMFRLAIEVTGELGEIAHRCQFDESHVELMRQQAYAQGAADCKAARCRLEAVPGPG